MNHIGASVENELVTKFVLNCGCGGDGLTYDNETGLYHNIPKGIFEFRIGDEVENVRTSQRGRIAALYPLPKDKKIGSPCIIEFENHTRCCVLMVRPTDPERIHFGFVVHTLIDFNGKPVGGLSRYETREKAEAEVSRLRQVNFPGAVQIITH